MMVFVIWILDPYVFCIVFVDKVINNENIVFAGVAMVTRVSEEPPWSHEFRYKMACACVWHMCVLTVYMPSQHIEKLYGQNQACRYAYHHFLLAIPRDWRSWTCAGKTDPCQCYQAIWESAGFDVGQPASACMSVCVYLLFIFCLSSVYLLWFVGHIIKSLVGVVQWADNRMSWCVCELIPSTLNRYMYLLSWRFPFYNVFHATYTRECICVQGLYKKECKEAYVSVGK